MGFDLGRDEIKHCIEMVTGLTGTVELGASELRATIVSYAGTFELSEGGPIYLRTQNNHVISLYDNVVFGPWRTTGTAPELSTFQADIHASFAIVGLEPWRPEDLVKRVSFRLEHARHILTNRDHLKKMENFGSPGTVLSVTEGDITVRLWYGGVYSNEFRVPTEYWPTIEVEFARGVPVGEFMSYVLDIAQLFSLCVWGPLQPSSLRISPLSEQELQEALRNRNDARDYAVEHVWPRIDIDRSDLGFRGSFLSARDVGGLRVMEASIALWLRRREQWKKPNTLMMGVLRKSGEVSAERLIAACRWFEEIPTASAPSAFSRGDIERIAEAAAAVAAELGHIDAGARIAGALRVLRRETREQLFARLLSVIDEAFGPMRLGEDGLEYLMLALRLRGTAAHGHFSALTEEAFRDCHNAILALEALCALLTAADLPLDREAKERASMHPALWNFHEANK